MHAKQLENELAQLQSEIEGEVHFDEGHLGLYSMDASNYRQRPLGVVYPKTQHDVVKTINFCRAQGLPIVNRGGGTSLTGACINAALVLDCSRYLTKVLQVNAAERWALVEPGVILDDLRDAAEDYGLTFGPDPATHNRCVLGGDDR